jgi:soluble lytic murein transglycosylase
MLRFALILLLAFLALPARAVTDEAANSLASALSALRSGAWQEADTLARRAGGVAPDIVEWHRLRAGEGSLAESTDFLERNADWPGLAYLRSRAESQLPIGGDPETVITFFGGERPSTATGSLALAVAYSRMGAEGDAGAQAMLAWLTQPMDAPVEAAFLARWPDELAEGHEARLDMLLWEGRADAARRMFPRVPEGWRKLAEARLALQGDVPGVDTRIEAVPAALADDPGLAYERFAWRVRRNRDESALELLLAQSPDQLGRPEAWSNRRRSIARSLMRGGDPELAYRVASEHGLLEGSGFADLEWLSGYLALTYLDRPDAAADHFARFGAAVQTPISLGRAGYWLGRAEEALGNDAAAMQAYAFGAQHQTSFYGQLAAEKAGIPMDPAIAGVDSYPEWESLPAADSAVFAAAEMLLAAGERNLAERFMVHLAESLTPEEMGALADNALERGEPHIALMIAKYAARQGIVLPRAYFPVVDLGVDPLPVTRELALAIARRESEFDPSVMSGAGARGLMQLMPGTAEIVSRNLGLNYSVRRLITDPGYNARLGTAYLADLTRRFGDNVILVSAGYNAGPGRPARWMQLYGDPRSPGVDPVDWIEHIPFRETQNYVMRVMESIPVYRARLAGEPVPLRLSEEMKAR